MVDRPVVRLSSRPLWRLCPRTMRVALPLSSELFSVLGHHDSFECFNSATRFLLVPEQQTGSFFPQIRSPPKSVDIPAAVALSDPGASGSAVHAAFKARKEEEEKCLGTTPKRVGQKKWTRMHNFLFFIVPVVALSGAGTTTTPTCCRTYVAHETGIPDAVH